MDEVKKAGKTSGIALVVVLGVIALLMIIGVGFSISMRIERMAARSYADTVRGRMLMQAAVARTMSDINAYMADPSTNLLVYPDWVAYGSPADSSLSNGVIADLLSDEALDFIPAGLRTEALAEASSVRWRDIEDPDGNFMGRYAYLIVDCSGFIDASTASEPSASRNEGRQPSELIIGDLTPDFGGNAEAFLNNRQNNWIRFETYPDMWTVGRRSGGGLAAEPENLFPYSRFTPDGFWTNGELKQRINIGGTASDLEANRAEIERALLDAGIASANVAGVFDGLLDYIDPDFVPRSGFSTEPVPMINEIIFSNMITRTTGPGGFGFIYQLDVFVTIETWYPFPGSVSVDVKIDPSRFTFTALPAGAAALLPTPADFVDSDTVTVSHGPANRFRAATFKWTKTAPDVFSASINNFGLRVSINGGVEVIYDGAVVDALGDLNALNPAILSLAMLNVSGAPSPVTPNAPRAAAVIDPRFNHDVTRWQLENPPTLEAINFAALNYDPGFTISDGVSTNWYVRNRPLVEAPFGSAAELGFLCIGEPWTTIALYDSPGRTLNPVLDLFTIEESPAPRTGLVNINSINNGVIASVFNDLPVRSIPGGDTVTRLTWAQATAYADQIIETTGADFFENISGLGRFNRNFFINLSGLGPQMTDADIESIIRHSYELFGIRQNLFTAIIAAQIMSPQGEVPIVDQRAVAVIWRDPFPNANGHHASFVRFFKPLVE